MFGEKAKKIQFLEAQVQQLQMTINQMGGGDVIRLQEYLGQLEGQRAAAEAQFQQERAIAEAQLQQTQAAVTRADDERKKIEADRDRLAAEAAQLQNVYSSMSEMVDSGYTEYAHPALSSIELGEQLQAVREEIKKCIKN